MNAEPGGTDVIRQDVRNFTVQIRRDDDTTVGTGIVVSATGLVATCAHVLRDAGIDPRLPGPATLRVYFPARSGRSAMNHTATVTTWFEASDDDLVCVQVQGPLSLSGDQVAVLGTAALSAGHRFESYGYRRLDRYLAGRATGLILGEVEPPEGTILLLDPVQLESSQINSGMSGAAVLDVERNLVVGLVTETWIADATGKDRDTAWAVNAGVLGFTSADIELRQRDLPLRRAERPVTTLATSRDDLPDDRPDDRPDDLPDDLPGGRHRQHTSGAPRPLAEWVGREPLLERLSLDWRDGRYLVAGLIGFGGEGKSSLARRWVDALLAVSAGDQPVDVFWWSFTDRASSDDFLAAALEFLSGGREVTGDRPVGSALAAAVAGLLGTRRRLFVLDGLETVQYQQGDQYGSIVSADLRDFLQFFATPGHRSFCLITSRTPVLDLTPYVTYQQLDVEALRVVEGRMLLRNLGVVGSDAALDQVVTDWGGHALTLSLLATYLTRRFGGDVRRVATIPPPDPTLSRDELVRRVLREYEACLSDAERDFLVRFSVFRTPVAGEVLRTVLPDGPGAGGEPDDRMLAHLAATRVLRYDSAGRLSMHPLIRDFFLRRGAAGDPARRALHLRVRDHYLSVPAEGGDRPSLDDLAPLIEAVHHGCRAGEYEHACDIVYNRLYLGERGLLTRELNAYETVLSVFTDFFPDQQIRNAPLVTDLDTRGWILGEVATCLQLLGRLRQSAAVSRRAVRAFTELGRWHDAAVVCQNMAELHLSLGALPAAREIIDEAFVLAERAQDKEDELVAETLRGCLAHLQGRQDEASEAFQAALRIAAEHTPLPALYSYSGIKYGEHLCRAGQLERAAAVHRTNLRICRAAGWRADEGGCHIGLGDVALESGDLGTALAEYEEAIRISRGITRRDVLIQALLARGRYALTVGQLGACTADLSQALTMASLGGYRLAEIDAHVAIAGLNTSAGQPEAAWTAAEQAEQLSLELNYHWGLLGARQAMGRLGPER